MMKRIRRNRGRRTAAMVLAVAAAALALHGLEDRAGLFAATMQDPDNGKTAPRETTAGARRAPDPPFKHAIASPISRRFAPLVGRPVTAP